MWWISSSLVCFLAEDVEYFPQCVQPFTLRLYFPQCVLQLYVVGVIPTMCPTVFCGGCIIICLYLVYSPQWVLASYVDFSHSVSYNYSVYSVFLKVCPTILRGVSHSVSPTYCICDLFLTVCPIIICNIFPTVYPTTICVVFPSRASWGEGGFEMPFLWAEWRVKARQAYPWLGSQRIGPQCVCWSKIGLQ
jgi:hypothetical protein